MMRIRARAAEDQGLAWSPKHEWVPLSQMSSNVVQAVLAAEDPGFYEHSGFDATALWNAWETGDQRGTSTISQQTAKNLYLSPARSWTRKAREALLTWWMERWLPKDRILELYLNVVELGPGIFGIEAAASFYFSGSAASLSPAQSALLAATLPAPLVMNPASPSPRLHRRQRIILHRMRRGYSAPDPFSER
jgi:monofunctional biosynthetic peptidoglycan transglycosylase